MQVCTYKADPSREFYCFQYNGEDPNRKDCIHYPGRDRVYIGFPKGRVYWLHRGDWLILEGDKPHEVFKQSQFHLHIDLKPVEEKVEPKPEPAPAPRKSRRVKKTEVKVEKKEKEVVPDTPPPEDN